MREWAKAQGFKVAERGRVPADIVTGYREATRGMLLLIRAAAIIAHYAQNLTKRAVHLDVRPRAHRTRRWKRSITFDRPVLVVWDRPRPDDAPASTVGASRNCSPTPGAVDIDDGYTIILADPARAADPRHPGLRPTRTPARSR